MNIAYSSAVNLIICKMVVQISFSEGLHSQFRVEFSSLLALVEVIQEMCQLFIYQPRTGIVSYLEKGHRSVIPPVFGPAILIHKGIPVNYELILQGGVFWLIIKNRSNGEVLLIFISDGLSDRLLRTAEKVICHFFRYCQACW